MVLFRFPFLTGAHHYEIPLYWVQELVLSQESLLEIKDHLEIAAKMQSKELSLVELLEGSQVI